MIITYGELHALLSDIEVQQNRSPAFTLFHRGNIKRLFEQNRIRIQTLQETLKKLVQEHAAKDENGNPVLTTAENGTQQLMFENELERKAYLDAFTKFATTQIDLIY